MAEVVPDRINHVGDLSVRLRAFASVLTVPACFLTAFMSGDAMLAAFIVGIFA